MFCFFLTQCYFQSECCITPVHQVSPSLTRDKLGRDFSMGLLVHSHTKKSIAYKIIWNVWVCLNRSRSRWKQAKQGGLPRYSQAGRCPRDLNIPPFEGHCNLILLVTIQSTLSMVTRTVGERWDSTFFAGQPCV